MILGEWTTEEYERYIGRLLTDICVAVGIDPNTIDTENCDQDLLGQLRGIKRDNAALLAAAWAVVKGLDDGTLVFYGFSAYTDDVVDALCAAVEAAGREGE